MWRARWCHPLSSIKTTKNILGRSSGRMRLSIHSLCYAAVLPATAVLVPLRRSPLTRDLLDRACRVACNRYRQFLSLHAAVSEHVRAEDMPHLPGKRILGSSVDPTFAEARGLALQVCHTCLFFYLDFVWKYQVRS